MKDHPFDDGGVYALSFSNDQDITDRYLGGVYEGREKGCDPDGNGRKLMSEMRL
jgi:hypothetical protein